MPADQLPSMIAEWEFYSLHTLALGRAMQRVIQHHEGVIVAQVRSNSQWAVKPTLNVGCFVLWAHSLGSNSRCPAPQRRPCRPVPARRQAPPYIGTLAKAHRNGVLTWFKSASSSTTKASLPPSSSTTGVSVSAAAAITAWPTCGFQPHVRPQDLVRTGRGGRTMVSVVWRSWL